MIEKEILRPADIAPLLGLTTGRVYQLIAEGVLPAVRVGGAIRVPREAWQRWLDERRDEALKAVHEEPRPAKRDQAH